MLKPPVLREFNFAPGRAEWRSRSTKASMPCGTLRTRGFELSQSLNHPRICGIGELPDGHIFRHAANAPHRKHRRTLYMNCNGHLCPIGSDDAAQARRASLWLRKSRSRPIESCCRLTRVERAQKSAKPPTLQRRARGIGRRDCISIRPMSSSAVSYQGKQKHASPLNTMRPCSSL